MRVGLFLADLALVNQRLDVRVIHGFVYQLAALEMVNPGVPGVHPMAVPARVDQKCRERAVGLLLGGYCSKFDDNVRFFNDLPQHGWRVIGFRRVAVKQLFGRQHDLVRRFSSAAAASHAICHDTQHATCNAGVFEQIDLILLVVPISLVDTGGSCDSITFGHGVMWGTVWARFMKVIDVLSDEAACNEEYLGH